MNSPLLCEMIKVAIVDDNRMIRNNTYTGLNAIPFLKITLLCNNGSEFLEKLKELKEDELPEIVLMDIDMPVMDGIVAVRNAKLIYPSMEFLMLTVFDEDDKIFEAIKAGASGYLLKDESIKSIAEFIHQVKEFRAVPMSPSIARKTLRILSESSGLPSDKTNFTSNLGERELEVLKLMVEGLDYKKIALKLGISHYTVRNQITSIYQKLHVTCKVDAVKIAIKNRLFR